MEIDLTKGKIAPALIKLALPIMGASFIQMAYNLTDMIWIGRLGSSEVASVGSAGFFIWLAFAFIITAKIGAEVGIAQSIGRKDSKSAEKFAQNSIQLVIFMSLMYSIFTFYFSDFLISIFNIQDKVVNSNAILYLRVATLSLPFTFFNPVMSGIYNGSGDSRMPFYVSLTGLIFNAILDPFLIYGLGNFPRLGVKGAAIATVLSQIFVTIQFILIIKYKKVNIPKFSILKKPDFKYISKIIKIGIPIGVQSGLFTIFSIILARIIAKWGPMPIAIQKVGAQIEAISWTTASGLSSALSAIVGQNFGAKKWGRIWRTYYISLGITSALGVITSSLLIFWGKFLFSLFIPDPEALSMGADYMRILGFSQLFMMVEIMTAGGFNGLGKTMFPAVISIFTTSLRIPLAIFLSSKLLLGLNGVWWSISSMSILCGIILVIGFMILISKHPEIGKDFKINQKIFKWDIKFIRDKKAIK